ncbi:MAG: glycosyltransferase family 4 protein [Synechococcales cyanobacterium C42_A2020_086]|jgi:glycosyltransferase involved in cell wall biosynthesis|nr:glycosyltransferase family 4 protein [Synechococcales cyanobacterium C42_A2020_086]
MRVIIVQHAGDYREAFQRFQAGQGETYYAQKYSVNKVADIGRSVEEIAVLCCLTSSPYNEKLANGVRAIGAGFAGAINYQTIIKQIQEYRPTHLILTTPVRPILRWAIRRKVSTLVPLADSFGSKTWKDKLRNLWLAQLLNHKQIHWVGNHGVTAAESLQSIGVNPEKIIPWDWPHAVTPADFPAKSLRQTNGTWNLLYVGGIVESKGVGDILDAVALLNARQFPVRLKLAGDSKIEFFRAKAQQLGIAHLVEFLGLIENKAVVPLMHESDVVLVPSRHEYPEGFPMTIYEAFCARTPIVASDHPMFTRRLHHKTSAMIFPAGNPQALAACVEEVLTNPELYRAISETTQTIWQRLQLPVQWGDLLQRWLDNSPESRNWLFSHRLTSGIYDIDPKSVRQAPAVLIKANS